MDRYRSLVAILIFLCTSFLRAQELTSLSSLPNILDEISGLTLAPDHSNELLAIQDEEGKLFRLHAETGGLLWSVDFGPAGDYEGITVQDRTVWVVKSSGDLYKIVDPGGLNQSVSMFEGKRVTRKKHNIEGLSYDPFSGLLFMICKTHEEIESKDRELQERQIYAFDPRNGYYLPAPLFRIRRQAIIDYLKSHTSVTADWQKDFLEKKKFKLSPSALAVHPQSGNLFILSSREAVMIEMDRSGTIHRMEAFDKNKMPQLEGLTFINSNTLIMSTEKNELDQARLFQYSLEDE